MCKQKSTVLSGIAGKSAGEAKPAAALEIQYKALPISNHATRQLATTESSTERSQSRSALAINPRKNLCDSRYDTGDSCT